MSAKHTPGPWTVVRDGARGNVETQFGEVIAIACHPFPFTTNDDERDANSHLIAAAPDLLAALIALTTPGDARDSSIASNYTKARAAIAKATGVAS